MNLARLAALLLFIAAVFKAAGWFVDESVPDALALVAAGLALEVLAGVVVIPGPK